MWQFKRPVIGLILVGAITLAAGCATTERYVPLPQVALPLPTRPVVPVIEPDALACLSAPAYDALVTRDALLQAHIRRLEAVIKSTEHSKPR